MQPGTVVGERYRLEELIGAGGMGSVWRARHVELDSPLAVKLMAAELSSSEVGERRFRREAQAAARLRSPHLVRVFDFGIHAGQPYLAMELLEGEDLSQAIEREGALPIGRVLEIVDHVAEGLGVAHEAGLLHRDLKPANIFLERVGGRTVAKVLDFGVAKELAPDRGSGTTAGGAVGSPAYMSPEQVWGEPLGIETDTWALGVVAYEALCGQNPFADTALVRVFDQIVKARVPSIEQLRPSLPKGLDAFFARAFARPKQERFASASELARALHAAVGGTSVASETSATGAAATGLPSGEANETLAAGVSHELPRRQRRASLLAVAAIGLLVVVVLVVSVRAPDAGPGLPSGAAPSGAPATTSSGPATSASAVPELGSAPTREQPEASSRPPAASAPTPERRGVPPRASARAPDRAPAIDPKWGVPVGSR